MERASSLKLDYIYGGVVHYQPGNWLPPRRLDDFELVLMIEGSATYIRENIRWAADEGSIILGRPGPREQYIWDAERRTRHAYIHFNCNQMPADWPAYRDWPTLRNKAEIVVSELFQILVQLLYKQNPSRHPGAIEHKYLDTLMSLLLHDRESEDSFQVDNWPEAVQQTTRWMMNMISDNPAYAFTLEELSEVAKVTPKHLCRLFAGSIGYGPVKTGTLMRLQLALALLTRSNLGVQQIAYRCGFNNPLYFSRYFSQVFGKSPSQMRSDIMAGMPPPGVLPANLIPRVYW